MLTVALLLPVLFVGLLIGLMPQRQRTIDARNGTMGFVGLLALLGVMVLVVATL